MRKIQTLVLLKTYLKLKALAALRGVSMGRVIDSLLENVEVPE